MLDALAPMFPDSPFDARCLGGPFRETWLAEYRERVRVYTQGPWTYDEEQRPRELPRQRAMAALVAKVRRMLAG